MAKDYSDQKLYSEEEILDVLIGLDIVYQSKSWIGKRLWFPWHLALETIAVMLTGNELYKRQVLEEASDIMLREEGYDDEN